MNDTALDISRAAALLLIADVAFAADYYVAPPPTGTFAGFGVDRPGTTTAPITLVAEGTVPVVATGRACKQQGQAISGQHFHVETLTIVDPRSGA